MTLRSLFQMDELTFESVVAGACAGFARGDFEASFRTGEVAMVSRLELSEFL